MQGRWCCGAWRTWVVLALLGLGCGALQAAARDFILERAYWDEPCTGHTPAQLPHGAFVPYRGLLARGYGPCAVWVRLLLAPAPDGLPPVVVLRILPTFLDTVVLHDPLAPPGPAPVVGDRHPPPAADGEGGRALQFSVPLGAAPRTVWLRLTSTSARMLDVQALTPQAAHHRDRLEALAHGGFFALLLVSLLWALAQWVQTRERVVGVFAIKQLVALPWALLLLGYGPGLLGGRLAPGTVDWLTSAAALALVSASAWFDGVFVGSYRVPRAALRLLFGVAAALPVVLALLLAGHTSLALQINACLAVLEVAVVLVLWVCARPQPAQVGVLPRGLLLMVYGLIGLFVGLSLLTQLGWLQGGRLALHGLFVHGLLTSVVMMALLQARAGLQARAVRELAAERARAEHERLHREDQERLVDMLVHEIKTPLSTLRMLLGGAAEALPQWAGVQRSLADMNAVVERCAQASQMESGWLQPRLLRCDVRDVLQDMAAQCPAPQRLLVSCSPEAPGALCATADAQWLRIILANLIDNACKYSPEGSVVSICAQAQAGPHGAGVAVEMANAPGAAGWPDAHQIFSKYYRSPHAHRQTGSGLGLYLVAGLAQRMQARMDYVPTPDHIRFRLWLPA